MSFPKPIDLTTSSRRSRKRSIDECSNTSTSSILFPSSSTPPSLGSAGSSGPSFDNYGPQPVFDLHSALNNINKTFTIGSTPSKSGQNRARNPGSGLLAITESPSPPPCPAPNVPLWGPLSSIHPILGAPSPLMTPHLINFSKSLGVTLPIRSPVSPPPPLVSSVATSSRSSSTLPSTPMPAGHPFFSMADTQVSKYNQLLLVLDEMNKDVRPSYAGNKSSVERLRRSIAHARYLVHEALIESERNSRN